MRNKPASEEKSSPSKFVLIYLLLSKAKVFYSIVAQLSRHKSSNFIWNGYVWLGEARVSPMLHNQLAMPDNSKMQVSGY